MGQNVVNPLPLWGEGGTSGPIRGLGLSRTNPPLHKTDRMEQGDWNAMRQTALGASTPPTQSDRDDIHNHLTSTGRGMWVNDMGNDPQEAIEARDAYIEAFTGVSEWL